jgi:hypothetical protein
MFNGVLFWVNGVDPPQAYNGTTLGPAGFAAATGSTYPLVVNNLSGCASVHNRLYFWTGIDCGFWYGDTLAITGELNYFPFAGVVDDNSNVVSVQILTYDGGQGIASYTIFTMSQGEVLVYGGTDPSDPNNWALVGVYTSPPPISPGGICRYGGDTYIITSSDYTKLSQLMMALKLGTVPPRSKAAGACQAAVAQGRGLTGWQAIYWGFGRRLIMNVPLITLDKNGQRQFQQHVYNTGLDAWCRYTGLPSFCWAIWNDVPYFGGPNGKVVQFGTQGGDELVADQIAPVIANAQQAWNLFGSPQQKRLAALRPIMTNAQDSTYLFGVGFDYDTPVMNIVASHLGATTPWNATPWNQVPWEAPAETDVVWYIAEGDGSSLSVACQKTTAEEAPLVWIRTDLRLEQGMAL